MIDDCDSCVNNTGYRDEYPCNECSVGVNLENHFEHIEVICEVTGCNRFGLKMTDGYCRARCDDCLNEHACSFAVKMNNTYRNQCEHWFRVE